MFYSSSKHLICIFLPENRRLHSSIAKNSKKKMSFPEQSPSLFPPPISSINGCNFFPQNQESFHQFEHLSKKPKYSDDSANLNSKIQIPTTPFVNRGTTNIFFKTRMCAKFVQGMCHNAEMCKFAHGEEDLRRPPENWQEMVSSRSDDRVTCSWDDDHRIVQKLKICKKFYNGEDCPYGERCSFIHEDPSRFKIEGDSCSTGRGVSEVIAVVGGNGFDNVETIKQCSAGFDASRVAVKSVYWKTKLCGRFEVTGSCPFGEKCHFAHGIEDLQLHVGRPQSEISGPGSVFGKANSLLLSHETCGGSPPVGADTPPQPSSGVEEHHSKKCLLKFKGSNKKKINSIYADWIEDDDTSTLLSAPAATNARRLTC